MSCSAKAHRSSGTCWVSVTCAGQRARAVARASRAAAATPTRMGGGAAGCELARMEELAGDGTDPAQRHGGLAQALEPLLAGEPFRRAAAPDTPGWPPPPPPGCSPRAPRPAASWPRAASFSERCSASWTRPSSSVRRSTSVSRWARMAASARASAAKRERQHVAHHGHRDDVRQIEQVGREDQAGRVERVVHRQREQHQQGHRVDHGVRHAHAGWPGRSGPGAEERARTSRIRATSPSPVVTGSR